MIDYEDEEGQLLFILFWAGLRIFEEHVGEMKRKRRSKVSTSIFYFWRMIGTEKLI